MATPQATTRHDWTRDEIRAIHDRRFMDLLYEAHTVHRHHFNPNAVQISTLLSIKTGACPEDCSYCPQSGHYHTDVTKERLLPLASVKEKAKQAKEKGASRFCMGAAWRHLPDKAMPQLTEMIKAVKDEGLETCMTLGMINDQQSQQLREAGLDYYNHNLDTSPEYYGDVITTRTYQDRLDTLERVRDAGIKVCCGGILGLGEHVSDRIGLLQQLANFTPHPQSVPINMLVAVKGTPLENQCKMDPFDLVRCIAVARILMPASFVRLSAGREDMNDEMQALCFFAGANSIFYGDTLLTTPDPDTHDDTRLFQRLGIVALELDAHPAQTSCQAAVEC